MASAFRTFDATSRRIWEEQGDVGELENARDLRETAFQAIYDDAWSSVTATHPSKKPTAHQ